MHEQRKILVLPFAPCPAQDPYNNLYRLFAALEPMLIYKHVLPNRAMLVQRETRWIRAGHIRGGLSRGIRRAIRPGQVTSGDILLSRPCHDRLARRWCSGMLGPGGISKRCGTDPRGSWMCCRSPRTNGAQITSTQQWGWRH